MGAIKEVQEEKKRSLREIIEEYRALLWHIEDNEGVVEDEWFAEMSALDADLATKVDRCLWVVDEFEGQAEVYAKRAKALADHAKRLKVRGKRLKDYVKNSMEIIGVRKLSTPNYSSVLISKAPPSLYIADEEAFISEYMETDLVRAKYSPDKVAAKEMLKGGQPLKHAELITDNTSLRYR